MGSNHFYFAKNSCEKIVPTHNRAARVLDPLSIAAASSHFDVNVDSDDDNDVYDSYSYKALCKSEYCILFIIEDFGHIFWTFCSRHFVFSKLDFGFLTFSWKRQEVYYSFFYNFFSLLIPLCKA
jgi:hypothetical protein